VRGANAAMGATAASILVPRAYATPVAPHLRSRDPLGAGSVDSCPSGEIFMHTPAV
jgi:hypothetical protein